MALLPGLAYEDFAARLSGKEEKATAGKHRTDFDCRLSAAGFRHAHIAQEQVGPPATGVLHGEPSNATSHGWRFAEPGNDSADHSINIGGLYEVIVDLLSDGLQGRLECRITGQDEYRRAGLRSPHRTDDGTPEAPPAPVQAQPRGTRPRTQKADRCGVPPLHTKARAEDESSCDHTL